MRALPLTPLEARWLAARLLDAAERVDPVAEDGRASVRFGMEWHQPPRHDRHSRPPTFVPELGKLEVALRVRRWRDEGLSWSTIADELNRDGVAPPRRSQRTTWSAATVRGAMRNWDRWGAP